MNPTKLLAIVCAAFLATPAFAQENAPSEPEQPKQPEPAPHEVLAQQGKEFLPLVTSEFAKQFCNAAACLPAIEPRTLHWNAETKTAIAVPNPESSEVPEGSKEVTLDESYYYLTRHGSPIAFSRALDLAAQHGLSNKSGARICDFGFSTVGHLRMLASIGIEAHGIEVNPVTEALYSYQGDQGEIPLCDAANTKHPGSVTLHYGSFPSDTEIVSALKAAGPLDAFFSKNTLKFGYIHPEREVDPRMTIDLGASDEQFCQTVHDLLKPGGLFVIYNIHPKPGTDDEPYIPWADGRCPFSKEVLDEAGFEVVIYNQVDTEAAHAMAPALGLGEKYDLDNDFLSMVTILRRR